MSTVAVRTDELIAGVPTLTATVQRVVREAEDTYTYWTTFDDPEARRAFAFRPGQISMFGVFGVGEVPISVSSDPARPMHLAHTIRVCGRVTNVIGALKAGDRVTVRGPFGRPWPVEQARGGRPRDRRRRARDGAAPLGRVRGPAAPRLLPTGAAARGRA